jgi:hypothetical protein
VRAHGGAVSVRSAPGEGAAFTLRFPLQRAETDSTSDDLVASNPSIQRIMPDSSERDS